jgi:UDPglucose 6-dehydrogenase
MILLVGYGFVGKAYFEVFKNTQTINIIDPVYNNNKIKDYPNAQGIIVCVPTPQAEDGSCDMSYVISVLEQCSETVPIMIKSTISLEGWDIITKKFPNHLITFSPEFLRAVTAIEDVLATKQVIVAGGDDKFWVDIYNKAFPEVSVYLLEPKAAITVKYFRNSFLATKVAFFNQIYDFCEKLGLDYRYVREAIALDNRIGDSHTYVFEDSRGFGGYCFPKDTAALLSTSKTLGIDLSILESAVVYNNDIIND